MCVLQHLLSKTQQGEVVKEQNSNSSGQSRVTYRLAADSLEPVVVVESKRFWTNDGSQFTKQYKEVRGGGGGGVMGVCVCVCVCMGV